MDDGDRAIVLVSRLAVVAFLVLFWGSAILWCTGCAAATVDPDGTVRGFAAAGGHVERCVPRGEAGIISSAPQECVRIEAQSIPSALFGMLGQAAAGLVGLVF
jgi:hypothetical protein